MSLSKEQEQKAKSQFYEDIQDVEEEDVEYASRKGQSKVNQFGDNPPGALEKYWGDIKLLIAMVTDYVKGNYKDVPWKTIAAASAAIIYFVSPIDVIPDFIPVVGYIDDALVIKLAIDFAGEDLRAYEAWKQGAA